MPLIRNCLAVFGTVLISACFSPLVVGPLPAADPANRAEVLVFRVYAFNAGAVPLAVGKGKEAFAILENSEYVIAQVTADEGDFFVQAHPGEPTKVRITLTGGDRICLKAEADPENLGKVFLPPLLMATGYRFTLAPVPCPSETELLKYRKVSAAYRPT